MKRTKPTTNKGANGVIARNTYTSRGRGVLRRVLSQKMHT